MVRRLNTLTRRKSASQSVICHRHIQCLPVRLLKTFHVLGQMRQLIKVLEAASLANVHQMIAQLPDGYNTIIGPNGISLSAGQYQRIGLAAALYGNPFLVVLDEPNSNLDGEGERALHNAIIKARERGAIVLIVAHRTSALESVNKVMVIADGRAEVFGPKDEVLKHMKEANQKLQNMRQASLAHQKPEDETS